LEAEEQIIRAVDGIVTGSPDARQELISLYDADPAYIVQIPNLAIGEDRPATELAEPWHPKQLPEEEQPYEVESAVWPRLASLFAELYENVLAVRRVAVLPADSGALVLDHAHDLFDHVDHAFETAIQTLHETRLALREHILEAANLMGECLQQGGKIMVCGVGQAARDARTFSSELMERSLPVLLLAADASSGAPSENEVVSDRILSQQVEVLGRPGDLLVGIATVEGSASLAKVFRSARLHDIRCLSLTGSLADEMLPDVALIVPSSDPQRVREVELLVLDLLCDLLRAQPSGTPQIAAEGLYNASEALTLLKGQVE
jgi:phosphoheptose isomerase